MSLKLGLDGFCEKMLFALTLLIMVIIRRISINNKFFDSKQNFTIFTNCFIEEKTNLIRIILTSFWILVIYCNCNNEDDDFDSVNKQKNFIPINKIFVAIDHLAMF